MNKKTKVEFVNGHPSITTELTLSKGALSSLLSVANRSVPSADAELMYRLMAGQKMKMRLFSPTNIMFYVTTAQLDSAVVNAKETWDRCYLSMLSPERLQAFYEKFADGKMAMSVQAFHLEESMEEIKLRTSPLSEIAKVS